MKTSLITLNGQLTHGLVDDTILLDRALHYGDGLFETIAIRSPIQNIIQHPLFSYHIKRLQNGCEKLFFPSLDIKNLTHQINDFLKKSDISDRWILKIVLTRGVGERGYVIPEPKVLNPNIILIQNKWPNYVVDYSRQGIQSEFSGITLYPEPHIAGVKHLNRLTQILASKQLSKKCQEALLLDNQGFVIEGIKSNLFAVIDGWLYTPCLEQQGILGVARAWILDYCQRENIPVKIRRIQKFELLNAEHIFVCNSVMGIWPVLKLENKQYSIGHLPQGLQIAWEQEV